MDGDRKYKQQGYQDSGRRSDSNRFDSNRFDSDRSERPRQQGPKVPIDLTGPRLPRLVQSVTATRCFNCAVTLLPDVQFDTICAKCKAELHCCKQCVNFDSSTRFQCLKSIPVRIVAKDRANTCELFRPILTVAKDAQPMSPVERAAANSFQPPSAAPPRNVSDARAAFDSLFKK